MNIYDIAKKCNVSIATVSRVLNGSDKVSTKTKQKVLDTMKECNYTPNAFARGLGLGSMRMIGILCTDVSDLYYAKAVSLMEKRLRSFGFDTLLCCSGSSLSDKKKALSLLIKKNVDAVVLIGSAFREMSDNSHIKQASEKLPVFIINGDIEMDNVFCVLCDEQKAMYDNVKYLVNKKVKDILYLYESESFSGKCKLSGLESAAKEYNVGFTALKTEKSMESAYDEVMSAFEKQKFSAILTSEDLLAVGALKALADKGVTMPVIGFNNSLLAKCCTPPLTSVDNMLEDLCDTTSDLLVKLLAGESVQAKTVFYAKLVERNT